MLISNIYIRNIDVGLYKVINHITAYSCKSLSAAAIRAVNRHQEQEETSSDISVCSITISSSSDEVDEDSEWTRIDGVLLTVEDKQVLLGNGWLNDKHIMAAQALLKDQSSVGGLQSPQLGKRLAFNIAKGDMVQILHSGGRHWVTASTIGTQPGHVRIYDSMYSDLPFSTKEQIAAIVCSSGPEITLEYANVQVCPHIYRKK